MWTASEIGANMDAAFLSAGSFLLENERAVKLTLVVILAATMVVIFYKALVNIPLAWGCFKDGVENRIRAVTEWPRKRKMRREKKNQLDNEYAQALEAVLEEQIEEGRIDVTSAQRQRHRFGKVLPKMKPKRDVKAGIQARLAARLNNPVELPDAVTPVEDQPGKLAKVFSWKRKPKAA